MRRAVSWLWKLAIVLGIAGYQFLVHSAFHKNQGPIIHFTLLMMPLIFIGWWLLISAKNKVLWLSILLIAAISIYFIDQQDHMGLIAVYGIPHAATYFFLLWLFGRTLIPGEVPLITRLATKVHGTLPADMTLYTRRITLLWCIFFAAQIIISVLLYLFASIDQWSMFINLLNFPLVVLMFVGDYIYRIIRFRHYPQASILKAIQAFTQDSSFCKKTDKQ